MPTYEYRCENGHLFEVIQRMADDAVTECTVCGAPVQRVFHPVAVHFKGSGFYNTDYGKKKGGGGDENAAKTESGKAADSKSESKGSESKGSDSKGSDSKGSDSKGSDSKGTDSKSSDSKTKTSGD